MAVTWITPAGNLRTVTERVIVEIPLEATSPLGNIRYSVIAGSLPRGLRLENNLIKGSPTEVRKFTTSRFVIRAEDDSDLEDRTFSISVDGSDIPEWITKEGFLKVGDNEAYFVLDNAYVDFQLEATDPDLNAGDILEYFLIPQGGQLPPGLTLSRSGRITGFTDPIFAIDYDDFGGYDTAAFDITPLDPGQANSTGFDTYFYDVESYDYSERSKVPRRLSRFYTFVVAVTDGVNEIRRIFKMWVVTEEFLKADNTIVQVDTNLFRADSSSNRVPLWITESYLGRFRANNYVTIYLDVYDPPSLSGTISYFLLNQNPDESPSIIPPGMSLDTVTGEIAGRVPYQRAITKTYTFTMKAVNFPASLGDENYVLVGDWNSATIYELNQAVRYQGFIYIALQRNRNTLPSTNPLIWNLGVATADKTFTVDIIGEIENSISWISDSDLGTIKPNQPSRLFVEAESLSFGGKVVYEFVSGRLPPGLELIATGILQGKVRQFADSDNNGLTRFFDKIDSSIVDSTFSREFNMIFDGETTTFDREFIFKVKARDPANVAENIKEFSIKVVADSTKTFANLYFKAFQNKEKRLDWYGFITNSNIFRSSEIYRYGDLNFGIQTELKVLLFAGIESLQAVNYVQAMSRNHYRKQLKFGDVKSAVAKNPETQEIIYEVIYVEIVDEYEKNNKSISRTIELPDIINSKVLVSYDAIKIDSDIPLVSDSDHQRIFPNSFKNMRSRIKNLGESDREFLPLWMRSIQSESAVETGFVKALTLCYLKPGFSESVISRIKFSEFDFKSIDFTIDRYLIDILNGEIENKYLAFPQSDVLKKESSVSQTIDAVFSVSVGTVNTFDNDTVFFDNNSITFDQD